MSFTVNGRRNHCVSEVPSNQDYFSVKESRNLAHLASCRKAVKKLCSSLRKRSQFGKVLEAFADLSAC
jgi:hypothetical protein